MGLMLGFAALAAVAGSQPAVVAACTGPSEFTSTVDNSRIIVNTGGIRTEPSFRTVKTKMDRTVLLSLQGDRGQVDFGYGNTVDLSPVVWSDSGVTGESRAFLSSMKVSLNRTTGEVNLDGDRIQFKGHCDLPPADDRLGTTPTTERFSVSWSVPTAFVLHPANSPRATVIPQYGDARVMQLFSRTLADGEIPNPSGTVYCDCVGYRYQKDGKTYYKITDARLRLVSRR